MSDFTKPKRANVDKFLLEISKQAEDIGFDDEIESIDSMMNNIRENMLDVFYCPFLKKKAIEELIVDLEKEKLIIFNF